MKILKTLKLEGIGFAHLICAGINAHLFLHEKGYDKKTIAKHEHRLKRIEQWIKAKDNKDFLVRSAGLSKPEHNGCPVLRTEDLTKQKPEAAEEK